jgi:uncharacterized lipoprotein YajG
MNRSRNTHDFFQERSDDFMGKVGIVFVLLILTACAAPPHVAPTPTAISTLPLATVVIPPRLASAKLTLVEFFAVT